MISVMSQESLATMMPSQHPASSLTYCFRRTPDQGLAPMPQGLDQGSLEAHWGLDLAPMEPLLHTLVRKAICMHEIHAKTSFFVPYL